MREIVLDTETTGLDPAAGHRVVEIGCVELLNHLPSGQVFHRYINPERDMPTEAFAVHGLSEEFLAGHPLFAAIAEELLDFLGDAPLVIHNADFDMKFLNWELKLLGRTALPRERAIDTVGMARRRFPGSPANLDALCRRFGIDNSSREKHGALLDAELLAEVYLELIGGREPGLALASTKESGRSAATGDNGGPVARPVRPPRPHAATAEELAAHAAFLGKLKNPLWLVEG
jgi:DNA polymerase-3 subunit epsilon